MPRTLKHDFGPRLRALREKAGLSRDALARKAELATNAIYLLEIGKRQPAWETLLALADALGVKLDTFRDSSRACSEHANACAANSR